MKALILSVSAFLILPSLNSLFAADPDLEQGIQFYKEKKNYEALGSLEKSLQKEKTGIAFYYRGNVKMNLKDYEEAISSYTQAYRMNYKRTDSLFNIACAYSLKGEARSAQKALLLNFLRGDKNLTRISKDPDLEAFRKDKDYSILLSVMEKPEGSPLKDHKDIADFLKKNGNRFIFYEYDTTSPGTIRFESGGLLSVYGGGGYAGVFSGGEWKLSESGLEYRELGSVAQVIDGKWVGTESKPPILKENLFQATMEGDRFYYLEKKTDTSWILVPPYKILRNSVQSAPLSPESIDLDKIEIVHRIGNFAVYPK